MFKWIKARQEKEEKLRDVMRRSLLAEMRSELVQQVAKVKEIFFHECKLIFSNQLDGMKSKSSEALAELLAYSKQTREEIKRDLQDNHHETLRSLQRQIDDLHEIYNGEFKELNTRLKVFDRENANIFIDLYKDGLATGIKQTIERADLDLEHKVEERLHAKLAAFSSKSINGSVPTDQLESILDILKKEYLKVEREMSLNPMLRDDLTKLKGKIEVLESILK